MDSVLRAVVVYFLLLAMFRISGKRSLAENSTFEFVLLLLISETAQQWLLGEDFSFTNAAILIATLAGLNVALSLIKQRSQTLARLIDGTPLVLVENGRPLADRMNKVRVDVADVLTAARQLQGLERMDQIKYAVLETTGVITIVPQPSSSGASQSEQEQGGQDAERP